MTNEEAIYLLGWMTSWTNDPKDLEAIRMAIEALRERGEEDDSD